MNIDVHQHVVPEGFLEAIRSDPEGLGSRLEGYRIHLSWGLVWQYYDGMVDMERRVREMDEARLDVGVISISPWLMGYPYPSEIGRRVCSAVNDGLAAIARAYPGRFVPAANVPLQDVAAAVAELESCGFPAVQIASHVNGRNLDDPELLPFFQAAERLGTFVFIHPNEAQIIGADRLGSRMLRNLIGNVTDTAVAAASLMFGGVLDACPDLKVCLAHAGGSTPFIWGRWEHGQRVRPEGTARTSTPISVLKKRFYFDTITHSPSALRYLLQEVGPERLVIGTDHPADMGDVRMVAKIEALDLPEEDKQRILGGTAAGLLRGVLSAGC